MTISLDVGRVRPLGGGVERYQHIGLGEVGGRASGNGLVGDCAEAFGPALLDLRRSGRLPLRDEVDRIPVRESQAGKVIRVDEHHPPAAPDAAVAVVHAVDRGVVLVVRANGLQQQPARGHLQGLHLVDGEDGPAAVGRERPGVPRPVRQGEATGFGQALFESREARYHVADTAADSPIVSSEFAERNCSLGEEASTDLRHDGDLTVQFGVGRRKRPGRGVHHPHRVLDGDALVLPAGVVCLGAPHGREDERRRPVTACEEFSLVDTWTVRSTLPMRVFGDARVGRRPDEVATHAHEQPRPCRRAWPGSPRPCRGRVRAAS